MQEQVKTEFFENDITQEGKERTLKIKCNSPFQVSIEDNAETMKNTITTLIENTDVTRITLSQKQDLDYNKTQTKILTEFAIFLNKLLRKKNQIQLTNPQLENLLFEQIKLDPISTYVQIKRLIRRQKQKNTQTSNQLTYFLQTLILEFEKLQIIKKIKNKLAGHKLGNRTIYKKLFNPEIRPDFLFTKLQTKKPEDTEEIETYTVHDMKIEILKTKKHISPIYYIYPPEFKLKDTRQELLNSARQIISEHKPKRSEFINPERLRNVFKNIGTDLITDLATEKKITLTNKETELLANILIRHTIGFGIIELLLADPKIQDITINSPFGNTPIFIVHQDYGNCLTNIYPTQGEGDSWATKLRLLSGRPLDEANPILDTEITVPHARARVSVVGEPVNPYGLAYSLRRHRDKPWTLPLFIKNKMINPLAAGLISFIIDGSRTLLIAGTRSAGKTSLLGSIMTEIMRKNRIITIEDTLELPVESLRQLKYNIQPLKTASALSSGTTEVTAEEGIRTTLRLGDSSLIVGEIRSQEAKALYEAMRIGALANIVAGTIHGDSPYGVYDRVVNDLGVQKTSFKATDIIIITNPIKTPDGLYSKRRVTQITEVQKTWEKDPLQEKGFIDLMRYNPETDELEPTPELINGESEIIKSIGGKVKQWAGSWKAIWENILLRKQIYQTINEQAETNKTPQILEADFIIKSNEKFHNISDQVNKTTKKYDNQRILFEWKEWLKKEIQEINESTDKN